MKQNNLHRKVVFEDLEPVMFADFLATHPRLYDGCELDTGTVDFLNQHFWFYEVNPRTFEQYYITKLKHVSAQYNNMKRVEFNELVFDVCTSKYVRKLVTAATNELSRTGGKSATTANTGTIKDDKDADFEQNGKTTYGKTETTTKSKTYETDTEGSNEVTANNDNKSAQRNMTMLTSGTNFDDQFNWPNGASGIAEDKQNNHSNTSIEQHDSTYEEDEDESRASGSDKQENDGTSNEHSTRTLNTQIHSEDQQTLHDLGEDHGQDDETLDITEGQGVDLIAKIWNYLATPKSLDFLIDQVSSCFILVY